MSDKKALLVEDIAEIAEHAAACLRGDGWAVDICSDGQSGYQAALSGSYHVLIFDRMLPDAEGLDLVERLRGEGVETPVLILTALGASENKTEGYKRGADDYLAKPFAPEELLARAGALHRRAGGKVRTDLMRYADISLHIKARKAHRGAPGSERHLALSPKEIDLLAYFLDNADSVITRDMLLRHVWNLHFDPGTNVVDVNVGRLRRKLEAGGEGAVLHTLRGLGYKLSTEIDEGES